ncbi:MAG TPA: AarF/ABC1/UbiB kinase family protein [Dehalococcoidia bacterium]|nr:AarF/ABC1/UbiB kinase family protein [Dehalococcoidia bacterium]
MAAPHVLRGRAARQGAAISPRLHDAGRRTALRLREAPSLRFAYAMAIAGQTLAGYRLVLLRRRRAPVAVRQAALRAEHQRNAERIYAAVLHLQGLMIKIGQTLGSNPAGVPAPYIDVLSRLQDAVPPRPWPLIRPAIEAGLGRSPEEAFARIEPRAVAAASLAQVHRATLHDGREVAVKVLYPGIERLVRSDLRVLRTLLWLESRFAGYPLQPVYDELAHNVPLEVDLLHEAEAMAEMAALLAGDAAVKIPRALPELSSRRVLVMEWIDGIKITDVAGLRAAGLDPQQLCERLTDLYCRQIFDFGFFHADPHPGNLFALRDGRLALVDFGLTRRLPRPVVRGLALLSRAIMTSDDAGAVEAFGLLGFRLRDSNNQEALIATANFFRAVTDPATYAAAAQAGDAEETLRAVNEAMRRANRANPFVDFPGEITLVSRVFGLMTGVGVGMGASPNVLQPVLRWTAPLLDGVTPSRPA